MLEIEDQVNGIKNKEKIREKRMKRNEQSLQETWDCMKRPNLHLIGVLESDRDNGTKLENTLQAGRGGLSLWSQHFGRPRRVDHEVKRMRPSWSTW